MHDDVQFEWGCKTDECSLAFVKHEETLSCLTLRLAFEQRIKTCLISR